MLALETRPTQDQYVLVSRSPHLIHLLVEGTQGADNYIVGVILERGLPQNKKPLWTVVKSYTKINELAVHCNKVAQGMGNHLIQFPEKSLLNKTTEMQILLIQQNLVEMQKVACESRDVELYNLFLSFLFSDFYEPEQRSLSQMFKRKPKKSKSIFGAPLIEAVRLSATKTDPDVPGVVSQCIHYLKKKNAKNEEGIYRISGNSTVVRDLKQKFNGEFDLSSEEHEVHDVAVLLKLYLRELPAPIFTLKLNQDFLDAADTLEDSNCLQNIKKLLELLPQQNYALLKILMVHFSDIVSNASMNKMNVKNIAIVLSPTLKIPANLFSFILEHHTELFKKSKRKSFLQDIVLEQKLDSLLKSNDNDLAAEVESMDSEQIVRLTNLLKQKTEK